MSTGQFYFSVDFWVAMDKIIRYQSITGLPSFARGLSFVSNDLSLLSVYKKNDLLRPKPFTYVSGGPLLARSTSGY